MFLWPRLEAIVIVALKMFTFWGNLFKVQTIKEGSSLVFAHALIIMRKGHRPAKR